MNEQTLANYLREFFAWQLDPYEVNTDALGDDLADALERRGYCASPYAAYEKALICPLNKRREKLCNCYCESRDFCQLLRKEGYV
jgi:hypothetical protein